MRIVVLESPFAGKGPTAIHRWFDARRKRRYARDALWDCLNRGEAVVASHLLYTQVLDDRDSVDRHMGVTAGHEFFRVCDLVVVYTDLGISQGMKQGMAAAHAEGIPIVRRSIPRWNHGIVESDFARDARRRLWPNDPE